MTPTVSHGFAGLRKNHWHKYQSNIKLYHFYCIETRDSSSIICYRTPIGMEVNGFADISFLAIPLWELLIKQHFYVSKRPDFVSFIDSYCWHYTVIILLSWCLFLVIGKICWPIKSLRDESEAATYPRGELGWNSTDIVDSHKRRVTSMK